MKEGWIQVAMTEDYPSDVFDSFWSMILLLLSLPLVYLTFSIPIYLRASYTSLQFPILLLHFILQNLISILTLPILAYFSKDDPLVAR